jgi:hypothetical protein
MGSFTGFSRLMYLFGERWLLGLCTSHSDCAVRQRFLNFHGQPCARLQRDTAIYEDSTQGRSFIIKTLSPICFTFPDSHLEALQKIWVDRLTYNTAWRTFIEGLNTEWQEMIIIVGALT